ncbi:MAG: tRNA (adenosine(37)-N6)-threonylcarbamoyltransferase complex transferase subunit TsaD [Bacteroidia bacterium]|nr:tRNA (adenosine(37)-N6)-threonylcarbamoyltransferase complex transferase subunit TsaD [Bacteroidia bacterium]
MDKKTVFILGIESSCDETSAAVTGNLQVKANVTASQQIHEAYGGVVPELASRAHQKNIIPVVDTAIEQSGITLNDLSAIAFTSGPGLIGSLMVGTAFAKALALALNLPIIEVNHMKAHVLAHFAEKPGQDNSHSPMLPFLCLTVSGGHTQLIKVESPENMILIGNTTDDAAGEAFDKIAKLLGLPYPGGPLIDQYATSGNPNAFHFPVPRMPGLDFSFSGLKTAVLYFLQREQSANPLFIEENRADLCASVQYTIITALLTKLKEAARQTGIRRIALAGGVSANKGLRKTLLEEGKHLDWEIFVPPFEYCTDNAAMISIAGYFKYLNGEFSDQSTAPYARFSGF